MTARPIIFSAPMIRALLAGQKTQTRRIVKPQPTTSFWEPYSCPDGRWNWLMKNTGMGSGDPFRCRFGQPGDLLWVREVWALCGSLANVRPKDFEFPHIVLRDGLRYQSDDDGYDGTVQYWRPSIHMPRWASRLTLRITEVRVQRVQDISEDDARAEGCQDRPFPGPWWQGYCDINGELHHQQAIGDQPPDWMIEPKRMADSPHLNLTAVDAFRSLWTTIHGPDSWSANPWVWALTFEVIRKNVDEVRE